MSEVEEQLERLSAALADRYRVERELGHGGMATVYLAEDLKHHRQVALKVLKPELAAVVGAQRFLAEVETTAQLQHPHILPLFDSGEADSFLYYVMPYVEGESLRDRLDRERQLPVDEAVRIAIGVANALDYAHRNKVVHRDIKPQNILIHDGEPVVADFGIALAIGAGGGSRLTETGLSVGTPFYMSPEQATGDQLVGPQTDTYALGCVLYEMLVGEPPYLGNTAQAVLGKIIAAGPISATEQRPSIPANVDAAIRCALEKLPADRFHSTQDLAKALADAGFRHGGLVGAGAATGAGPWKRLALGFAATAAALAMAFGWSLLRPEPSRPVQRFSLARDEGQVPNEWLALSPDGSALVMAYPNSIGQTQLFIRRWGDLTANPISGTEGETIDPMVSPDGREVAFFGSGQLKVAPLQGGLVRVLADSATCCVRWSADGLLYYSAYDRSIRRVPASGGQVEQVTEFSTEGEVAHSYFQILPGGEVGVFTVLGESAGRIEAMDMASGRRVVLTEGVRSYVTPTGHLVFASLDGRLFAAPFDDKAMELTSAPVPLVENLGIRGTDAMYSLSNSGDLVYWQVPSVDQRELVWVTRTGEVSAVDPSWTGQFESVALSPDGERLAVTEGFATETDLWIKQLDRGPASLFTFTDGLNRRPTWTRDGLSVTFITNRDDNRDVYVKRADGIGSAEMVLDLAVDVDEGFWSPDGDWLIYRTGIAGGERDVFAWRSGPDSVTVPVSAAPGIDEFAPALSPDGKWLAYVSDETGLYEVWVRPFPDVQAGRRQISVQGGTEPVWAHSGRELFYKSQGNLMAVGVQTGPTFTTGEVRQLFSVEGYFSFPVHRSYDVTEDDQRFVMIRVQGAGAAELILVQNFFEVLKQRVGS